MTLQELRADFVVRRKGGLALPIAGIIAYSAAALLTFEAEAANRNLILTACFWSIMPLGLLIGRLRGEEMRTLRENPLFQLSAWARIMALSTWAIHIPVWAYAPDLFPITVGIGFALHWVVFSWTLGHPVGFIHLALRILLVLAMWHLFPANRVGAVSAGIAATYAISVVQLRTIDWRKRLGLDCDPFDGAAKHGAAT